jgi:transcriptional regulator with XRE-family HTH domain
MKVTINQEDMIRKSRLEKKLTQRDSAKLSGLSQQHIQRLEAGISPVRLEAAIKISGALGMPVGKVFRH